MKYLLPFFLFFCLLLPLISKASDLPPPDLMLAKVYQQNIPLNEYWVSEKLDGVRAYWNGEALVSRQGNIYHAPSWFIAGFPKTPLDGELWIGRNKFESLSGLVRKNTPIDKEWQRVSYQVFDRPPEPGDLSMPFSKRLEHLRKSIPLLDIPWMKLVPQYRIINVKILQKKLQQVVAVGGEGLMLHRGDSLYKARRSNDLLKLKPYFDAEAVVIKHLPGKGKYSGMLGSLLVKTPEGLQFRIGTGFSDQQRRHPPAVGVSISYQYRGKTRNGVPRFASFLRVREKH